MEEKIMKNELVSVKTYDLTGDAVRIVFSMKDPDELELLFEDEQGERKFSGREISEKETELGSMRSVLLEAAPDWRTITLSLAVPSANRPDNVKSIPVKTFAVITTRLTSPQGPQLVEGQIEAYEIHVLEGNTW
jgi:hypothetical protein